MRTESTSESLELDEALRNEICRMKRNVDGVPQGIRTFFYDLCREEPRVKHPLGQYPHAAFAFARIGAPWSDVVAPMNLLKGLLWQNCYSVQLPCLMEVVARETEANAIQNHATHRVLRDPRNHHLDSFIESCDVQIAETRLARAVAVSMKSRAD